MKSHIEGELWFNQTQSYQHIVYAFLKGKKIVYVGIDSYGNEDRRLNQHLKGDTSNIAKALKNVELEYKILALCDSKKTALDIETFYINKIQPKYNVKKRKK